MLDLHSALAKNLSTGDGNIPFGKFGKIGRNNGEHVENIYGAFLSFSAVFGRFPNSGKAMTEMPVHFSLCVLGAKIGLKIWIFFMLDMSFLLPATILDQGERPQKKILCYGVRIHKDPPGIFV